MNPLEVLPSFAAFDALRIVYEVGLESSPAHAPVTTAPPTEPPVETVNGPAKEGKDAVAEAEQTPSAASSPPQGAECEASGESGVQAEERKASPARLSALSKLIHMRVLKDEKVMSRVSRHTRRHRTFSLSSSGSPVSTPSGTRPPVAPSPSMLTEGQREAATPNLESELAMVQVVMDLLRGLLDRVVYSRDKAAQRYEDAMMHFVLSSALSSVIGPRLQSSAAYSGDFDVSDDSEISQHPRSPKGFVDLDFPDGGNSSTYPDDSQISETNYLKEREQLFARYETCCEVIGTIPLSSVLDRLLPPDFSTGSSLTNSITDPRKISLLISGKSQSALANVSCLTAAFMDDRDEGEQEEAAKDGARSSSTSFVASSISDAEEVVGSGQALVPASSGSATPGAITAAWNEGQAGSLASTGRRADESGSCEDDLGSRTYPSRGPPRSAQSSMHSQTLGSSLPPMHHAGASGSSKSQSGTAGATAGGPASAGHSTRSPSSCSPPQWGGGESASVVASGIDALTDDSIGQHTRERDALMRFSISTQPGHTPLRTMTDAGIWLPLRALNFDDCEGLGRPECLIPLLGLIEGYTVCTSLSLGGIGLSDAGVCMLVMLCEAHLPNLQSLDIRRNPLVTDACAPQLHRLLRLQENILRIRLSGTSVSSVWSKTIKGLARRNVAFATEKRKRSSRE